MSCGNLRDHLAVIGRRAEHLRVERIRHDRFTFDGLGEFARIDFWPLRYADLNSGNKAVSGRWAAMPSTGRIYSWCCAGWRGPAPRRSEYRRHSQGRAWSIPTIDAGYRARCTASLCEGIEDRIESVDAEVVDALSVAGAASRLNGRCISTAGGRRTPYRRDRARIPRRRSLAEDPDRSRGRRCERKVEVGYHGIQCEIARDCPRHVVRDGRRSDTALCTDDGDDAADGLRFGCGEQPADRAYHVDGVHRRDHIIADAATNQFAIKHDVIDAADHDDARAGIAHGCELIEAI